MLRKFEIASPKRIKLARLTKEEQSNIDYYNRHSQEWFDKHPGRTNTPFFKKEMDRFLTLLPKGKVIEIGCGGGKDASFLISHYGPKKYLGIDASAKLIKIAKKLNPNGKFINTTLYNLPWSQKKFDGFWASAVLIHLPKSRLPEGLRAIHSVLKQNGVGFISVLGGTGDMVNSRPGRYYSLYTREEFQAQLRHQGYQVEFFRQMDSDTSPWLNFIVRVS